jgi:ribosomal protein L11 methyltransferase
MAFGTGQHPTTALCAERLDELLAKRPGAEVLDVGTGSGVLALLAARLGAGRRIVGTENDPIALRVAAENTERNGLAPERIAWQLCAPDELQGDLARPYDVVVANILLNTLTELAPQIARKVAQGGHLVLSGLLSMQGGLAEAAYEQQGLRAAGRRERDGWVRVELVRP